MDQARLIRAAFVIAFALILSATASMPTSVPAPDLRSLATDEADFRGCDRDWNRVNDFWGGVTQLYETTSAAAPESDVRANDRDWCNVRDYSTSASPEEQDAAVKLIELAIVSADEEESPD